MKMFWRRWLGKTAVEAVGLPTEVQQWIATRQFAALQHWLLAQCERRRNVDLLPALSNALRQARWPEIDIAKLELLAHFAAALHPQAIELARQIKASQTNPDVEVLLIEAFSLFHCHAFEEAWQILLAQRAHWPEWENRVDFRRIAMLLAHTMADDAHVRHFLIEARRHAPDDAIIALNGYGIAFELGEMAEFARIADEIAAGKYDLSEAALALAHIELAQGRYAAGWRIHEGRYRMKEAGRYLNPALLDRPLWQGEPLGDETLLVSCEQGLGDTLMMARYFPMLGEKGIAHLLVETQKEALPLLQENFPTLRFVERRHGQLPDEPFDCWCGSMSLPSFFAARVDGVPARGGYLAAPAEGRRYWRQRLDEAAPGRLRIGLCWSGSRTHRADRRRSLAAERLFAAIAPLDACFFTLQKEIPPAPLPANLIDVSEELITLADTAALIESLDLTISIDSMPVHLAGALGKACWLMLPYRYEWRWGLEGESNPWYDSVRVFRQQAPGDWDGVLREVFATRWPQWRQSRRA